MKLADALSLRSRRRKLRLFLDEMDAGPTITVVDVGVERMDAFMKERVKVYTDVGRRMGLGK